VKSIKVVLTVLMALVLLVGMAGGGCAKKPPTDSLTVAMTTFETDTFLPWNGGVSRQSYMLMVYECLVYTDTQTGMMMPGLATKWEMSPDGKVWTLHLHKGIQFQENWGEMTSADVVYSLQRMLDPKSIGSPAGNLRSEIDNVAAPDAYTVVITLKVPDLGLVASYLSDANAGGIIVCKKYVETVGDDKANAHPIGTGPYTLAETHQKTGPYKFTTVPGVEKHWRVVPEFKNVTFLMVPEEATRVAMLKTGEVDLAPISYDSIDTIKASGLHIATIPKDYGPLIRFTGLVQTDPARYKADNPWVKVEVRQALNYAVDKDSIAKNIFKGQAIPCGASMPLDLWMNIPPYPYDVAKAKQLLATAGYPNGFPLTLKTLTATPGAELPAIGQAVAMYWKAIGIDVKIVPSDWATVRTELLGKKANDYMFTQRGQPFPDPSAGLDLEYNDAANFCIFETQDTLAMYKAIKNEVDPKKRDQLVKDFGLYVKDQATNVFLCFADEPYGASAKVGTWTTIRMRPSNIDMITHGK